MPKLKQSTNVPKWQKATHPCEVDWVWLVSIIVRAIYVFLINLWWLMESMSNFESKNSIMSTYGNWNSMLFLFIKHSKEWTFVFRGGDEIWKKKPEGEDSITSLKLKQVSIEKDVILKFKIQCKNIRSWYVVCYKTNLQDLFKNSFILSISYLVQFQVFCP